MKTEEGNKLIWVFMERNLQDARYTMPELLRYHKSWDWLMPVVRKAYKMIGVETYKLDDEFDRIHSILFSADIELVWDQTVEFIQWYNENKKE